MRIIDISPPLENSLGVWPGDAPFVVSGSEVRTTLHAGAHVDEASGFSLETFLGPCQVVSLDRFEVHAPRVLFKTNTFRDWRNWNHDFASLTVGIVEALHARGVILIGIDTPSVDPFASTTL